MHCGASLEKLNNVSHPGTWKSFSPKVSSEAVISYAQSVSGTVFIVGIAPNILPYRVSCSIPLCSYAGGSRGDELWTETGICKHPLLLMVPQTSTFPNASGVLEIWGMGEFSEENGFNDFSSVVITSRLSKKWIHNFSIMEMKRWSLWSFMKPLYCIWW